MVAVRFAGALVVGVFFTGAGFVASGSAAPAGADTSPVTGSGATAFALRKLS